MGRIKGFKWSGWVYPAQQTQADAHVIGFSLDAGSVVYKEWDIVNGKKVKCACKKYKSIKEYKKINGK